MENYAKGKDVEQERSWQSIPIDGLPQEGSCTWMRVRPGSKMRGIIEEANKAVDRDGVVLFSGAGPAVTKVVSCAEIVKRKHKDIHQYSKVCYKNVEEHWDSKVEDLAALMVIRDIPEIFVVLSKTLLSSSNVEPQKPLAEFLQCNGPQKQRRRGNSKLTGDLGMYQTKKNKRSQASNSESKASVTTSNIAATSSNDNNKKEVR